MTRYADIKYNDIVDCDGGICVSYWAQGCPFKCPGCHNPETWDFHGGKEFDRSVIFNIISGISKNGIKRDFAILGGEPLCPENIDQTTEIARDVRIAYPNIKIYLWTGYEFKDINNLEIIKYVDTIITGPYIESQRDITLKLCGSTNQKVLRKHIDF